MSTQDIVQAAVISLLAGLCWWQAGQDDTVLGCAWAGCLLLPATQRVSMLGSVSPRSSEACRSCQPALRDVAAWGRVHNCLDSQSHTRSLR